VCIVNSRQPGFGNDRFIAPVAAEPVAAAPIAVASRVAMADSVVLCAGMCGVVVAVKLLQRLADSVKRGEAVASATVVDTSRSVPRRPGAKMLVFRDGSIAGTVGGGEMEARVVDEAVAALSDGRCRLLSYRLVDPDRGDPGVCGGDVQIFVEPHMPEGSLIVIGYGHVGRAVTELAQWLGFRVTACDDRPSITDAEQGNTDSEPDASKTDLNKTDAEQDNTKQGETDVEQGNTGNDTSKVNKGPDELVVGSVDDLLAGRTLTADVSVVLVTRNIDVDTAALPALLATDAGYVGVMGSERRWATTRARLEADGVDPGALDRVHAPIGVELGAETPEEIALSIMAEVIAHRRS